MLSLLLQIYNGEKEMGMENLIVDLNTLEAIEHYLPSNADLSGISNFYSLFSDVTRLRMLSALSVSELCVSDLSTILDLNQTTVSHQLKLLRDSKIVSTRRNGKIIYYRIINKFVEEVMLTGARYICEIYQR